MRLINLREGQKLEDKVQPFSNTAVLQGEWANIAVSPALYWADSRSTTDHSSLPQSTPCYALLHKIDLAQVMAALGKPPSAAE